MPSNFDSFRRRRESSSSTLADAKSLLEMVLPGGQSRGEIRELIAIAASDLVILERSLPCPVTRLPGASTKESSFRLPLTDPSALPAMACVDRPETDSGSAASFASSPVSACYF